MSNQDEPLLNLEPVAEVIEGETTKEEDCLCPVIRDKDVLTMYEHITCPLHQS